jgi:hypothetical protein
MNEEELKKRQDEQRIKLIKQQVLITAISTTVGFLVIRMLSKFFEKER